MRIVRWRCNRLFILFLKEEEEKGKSCIYTLCMYCIRLTGWLVEFLCVACVLIWRKDIASRDVANRAEIERNRATGGGRRPDSVGELDRRVASGHSTQLLSLKTLLFLTCWLRLFYCQLLCVRVRVCPLYISPTTLGNRRRQKNKELKKVRKT